MDFLGHAMIVFFESFNGGTGKASNGGGDDEKSYDEVSVPDHLGGEASGHWKGIVRPELWPAVLMQTETCPSGFIPSLTRTTGRSGQTFAPVIMATISTQVGLK